MEKLVTLKELAEYMKIGPQTLRKMAIEGQIPSVPFKRGRCTLWRFKLSQVDQALSSKSA